MMDEQRISDMLAAMQAQRDSALNAIVVAQAEIAALRRELAMRDEQIGVLKTDVEKLIAATGTGDHA
jgi:hypothetical protein